MKIGIITVHDSQNFGSFLQAFALRTVLLNLGHDVYFIQRRSSKEVKKSFIGKTKNIKKYLFNCKKYKNFSKDIEMFKTLTLDEVKKDNNIDVLIIGSDELWNINIPSFRQEYFYGIGLKAKKKIAYAISSGSATYNQLLNYQNIINGIKELDKIFVRDRLTEQNIEKISGIKPEFTCDPTFLIDICNFKKESSIKINYKYILIYSYLYTEKQKEYITKYARERGLKILSAGLYCSFADKNINCSPLEFSEIICKAEAVITTTFHGTIFSILNKKKFVVFEAREKTKDVLEKTGLLNAMIDENKGYNEFEKQFEINLDFENAHKLIKEMREISIDKLKNELNN